MKILTRYIFKEMVGPTLLGFGFYTFIILVRNLFDMAGMIIKRSLPAHTVAEMLLLSLPHIVVLTVPMSLLFGILIAVGRLSADSEIIAMRALGMSTRTIYRPVFIFSFLMFLLNLYLINVVQPAGNIRLQALRAEAFTSSVEKEIKPRLFYNEYENLMIYVNDLDTRTGRWRGVFVADSRTDVSLDASTPQKLVANSTVAGNNAPAGLGGRGGQRIIVAESGSLSIVKQTRQVWMNLRTAENHAWEPRRPDRYDRTTNVYQRMLLPDKFSETGRFVKGLREMTLPEYFEQLRLTRGKYPDIYRAVQIEIHKKFSLPFACIVFGVLGLPLGITNRRGGKSSGFSLSIGIIMVYYLMITNGERLSESGQISPAVAMWAPNILLLSIGIYLLAWANREARVGKEGGVFSSIRRIINRIFSQAPAVTQSDEHSSILSRLDITFPNILDRYVLREFLRNLALVLISTIALALIISYTELSGDIRDNHIPLQTVLTYYRFMIPQIVNWTLPISVLVSTLVTFGVLAKNNEVTAAKSVGLSLYRVALPIVFIAAIMSIAAYFILDFVLPYSNQRAEQLERTIKGKKTVSAMAQQKLWFLGKGRYLINFLSYDRRARELSQVQVFELHPTEFRLTRRIYAETAKFDGQGWVFSKGWVRSFLADNETTFTPIATPIRLYYGERPEDFETEVKSPDQMTFGQLRRYIENITKAGYAAEELTVKLYEKTSWPFISMVMVLIALPFAFKIGRRGALYGVGIALVLGIFYWMVFAIFTKFGEVGNLPAILSAWSANILFAIGAIYMFLHVET
ncbi:MAG TPA: LPS export ABC transporter permease LptG [Thermoanaerobaculia bacterium]|nr:LPS export ABC transporter permease LptG [Thermoanaerobaculia bacterium]